MTAITSTQAKKLTEAKLRAEGLSGHKLSAKTVDFTDLARDKMIFVTVHNWTPNPKAECVQSFAKDAGFRVEFKGNNFIA